MLIQIYPVHNVVIFNILAWRQNSLPSGLHGTDISFSEVSNGVFTVELPLGGIFYLSSVLDLIRSASQTDGTIKTPRQIKVNRSLLK